MASHSFGNFLTSSFWFLQQPQQNKCWSVVIIPFRQVWKWGPQGGKELAQGHRAREQELSLRSPIPPSQRQHSLESVPTVIFLGWHWTSYFTSLSLFPRWQSQFSCSVVSDSLQPNESQHARPPCTSATPGVYSNSCPSSRWCHRAISSNVVPFSSFPQSLPASGSFPMSQL